MNIAVDGTIFHLQAAGGISRIYAEIMPRIVKLDPDVRFSLYVKPPYRQQLPNAPRINVINLSRWDWRPSRIWRRVGPYADRLLAAATLSADAIWHATYFTLPPRRVKATMVTLYDTIHVRFADLLDKPRDDALRVQQRASLQAADLVWCISQATADDAVMLFNLPTNKLRVVRLAPDPIFRPLDAIEGSSPTPKPFLLFVGGRGAYKNFAELLTRYGEWDRRREFDLVVVGANWMPEERAQIATLGIDDCVSLLHRVDDGRLCELYNRAAALVYPSLAEGFGLPPLEAMACGCPVVAAALPVIQEVSGSCPFYFDPARPESLMPAVEAAIRVGHEAERVAAGKAQAAIYSWDTTARETLALYRELG
ncbi:MAG TPA: glycosyltransferase family 1 protein [Aggregatilineales bacterium]|nr:glycosyltransferase family 1 protein [Aggregatilineales bacterium]